MANFVDGGDSVAKFEVLKKRNPPVKGSVCSKIRGIVSTFKLINKIANNNNRNKKDFR